ncbi:MAG: NAD(+)/NADH kinase [Tissierellia bacterium]|nr:NAD(+)/NADH kinase [Tissierellia bacterium]MDD4726272.1 NAD(+)/NADH kinase [Tissierellia bacterium]
MDNSARMINIISNRNFESKKTKLQLLDELGRYGLTATESYNMDAELNICIGGDGSFLRAIHRNKFPTIPFVGINTGHLGFFQEIAPANIEEFVKKYVNNEYSVEEILLLNTVVHTKNKYFTLTSINEIVIKGTKSKVVHLSMYIDGNHLQKISGDGVIVSTPAGSTAYNFSSGGSIVYPSINCLQVSPLSPISSKAFRSLPTSIIVPGDLNISIKPEFRYKNSILVVNDGMEYKYDDIVDISFTMSNKKIYRLKFSKDSYWENFINKFL